jgi:hypothetical protein
LGTFLIGSPSHYPENIENTVMHINIGPRKRLLAILFLALAFNMSSAFANAEKEIPQVLVMDIEHSKTIESDTAQTITDLITTELGTHSEFDTLSGEDIRRLMTLEGEKAAIGCDTDQSCLAELAGAMGARFVVYGRLSTLGKVMVLQLNLFDAMSASAVGRVVLKARDLETFADTLDKSVNELIAPLLAQLNASNVPVPAPETSSADVAAPNEGALESPPATSEPAKPVEADNSTTSATPDPASSPAPANSETPAADSGGGVMGILPWAVAGGGGLVGIAGITSAAAVYGVTSYLVLSAENAQEAKAARNLYFDSGLVSAGVYGGVVVAMGGIAIAAAGAGWGLLSGGEE